MSAARVCAAAAAVATLMLAPAAASAQMLAGEIAYNTVSVGGTRVTELVAPFGLSWRLGPLRFDANSAYARATVEGDGARSERNGLIDVTARVMLPLFADRIRFIVAGNIPTHDPALSAEETPVAAAVATDLFALPVASFGSGLGVTSAVTLAQPLGTWVLGLSGAYRAGDAYEPFLPTAGQSSLEFRPGQEYRVRLGLDRPHRNGWAVRLAVSGSRFEEDLTNGAVSSQSGDRYLGEALLEFPLLRGSAIVYGWDLYRDRGKAGSEQLSGAQ
ncbi:MAG: hypothetical protein HY705_08840, partial [Gemmatimonadetes bacterium]|nr:hypothetical protein [Gemmatimonadota bacterium]